MAERTLNTSGTHVYLCNPETGGLWECPVDVVELFVTKRGWEYAEAADDSLEDLVDAEPEQTGFDPSAHNADEVSAHLALHAETSPGEVSRVLELERAGKNRKSVVVPDGFDPINGE